LETSQQKRSACYLLLLRQQGPTNSPMFIKAIRNYWSKKF